MFRKAREQMQKEARENPSTNSYEKAHDSALYAKQQRANLKMLEEKVNKKARSMTQEYLRSLPNDLQADRAKIQSIQEQTYLVYKFVNSPIDMLMSGMKKMD